MTVKQKIEDRLDKLEAALKAGQHLGKTEDLETVIKLLMSLQKFFRVMTEEQRDFLNAAMLAVEDQIAWV